MERGTLVVVSGVKKILVLEDEPIVSYVCQKTREK